MKLSHEQRKLLAEFFGNFAVAWLAAGLIAPYFTNPSTKDLYLTAIRAFIWAGLSILAMLYLAQGGRK